MTTLILAQKRILTSMPSFGFVPTLSRILDCFAIGTEKFALANRQGRISALLIGFMALAVFVYLAALFYSFSLGFAMQDSMAYEGELIKSFQEKELLLQDKINLLASRQDSALKSMEKVSEIKYLTAQGLAIKK